MFQENIASHEILLNMLFSVVPQLSQNSQKMGFQNGLSHYYKLRQALSEKSIILVIFPGSPIFVTSRNASCRPTWFQLLYLYPSLERNEIAMSITKFSKPLNSFSYTCFPPN